MMVAASTGNSFAKEMAIRKRMSNIFNKREEDFTSLKEYNDYLEEVEDMASTLIEGKSADVAAIEAKMLKYQEENAEQIIIARARKAEELAAALKACKGPNQTETSSLVTGHGTQAAGAGAGAGAGFQGQYAPAVLPGIGLTQPRPLAMAPQPVPISSLIDPLHGYEGEDEEGNRLKAERAARAGGWTVEMSRKRALEEAFSSIWI
ncbi:hypothetical protein AXF42_Ash001511 [Apostasia shenzhenica]|uniref:MAT1 centre domain-containing protein n=1 Tax=Apostasia shenzhenica TaxID=1088818 RepID=A0A2I0AAG8_9ASPA|nr:hypothetical protein AXF42_Ash001511 [Apostasia shenzhenica]